MSVQKPSGRRVMIVSDSYPPLTGGATLAAEQLALGMQRRGWRVLVATSWQRGMPEAEVLNEVKVLRLRSLISRFGSASSDPHRYTPPPFPDPELAFRIDRAIRRFRPTLIHSYGWITYSLLPVKRRTIPMVLSARDYGYVCPKRTLLRSERPCTGPALGKCLACAPICMGDPKPLLQPWGFSGNADG